MGLSFTFLDNVRSSHRDNRRVVLVTGAGGKIGAFFAKHSAADYDLRLLIHHPEKSPELAQFGEIIGGEIADLEFLKKVFSGIDTVVHLAGDPSPSATWESLHAANIVELITS